MAIPALGNTQRLPFQPFVTTIPRPLRANQAGTHQASDSRGTFKNIGPNFPPAPPGMMKGEVGGSARAARVAPSAREQATPAKMFEPSMTGGPAANPNSGIETARGPLPASPSVVAPAWLSPRAAKRFQALTPGMQAIIMNLRA